MNFSRMLVLMFFFISSDGFAEEKSSMSEVMASFYVISSFQPKGFHNLMEKSIPEMTSDNIWSMSQCLDRIIDASIKGEKNPKPLCLPGSYCPPVSILGNASIWASDLKSVLTSNIGWLETGSGQSAVIQSEGMKLCQGIPGSCKMLIDGFGEAMKQTASICD